MDSGLWQQVSPVFDELITLEPADRRRRLDELDGEVRNLLERLLSAHESPDTLLLDQTLSVIAARIGPETAAGAIPTDLAGRRFGNWVALEEIGRGGMGVVMRGERADGQYEMQVAIKLLSQGRAGAGEMARFGHELRVLARLQHPAIARLIDGGISDDGLPYLVMEYVDGVAITRYCREHRLPIRERVDLFIQVAEAVSCAHQRLIIHSDIKPSNVLIDREGRARLLDFGIASLLEEDLADAAEDSATPKVLRCSPSYAAPEQLKGASPSTAQDVFGLGALLYELLSGHGIRGSRNALDVLFAGEEPAPIPPASVRSGDRTLSGILKGDLDAVCLKALADDPNARYPSADALIADLRRWLRREPVAARGGGRAYRAGKWLGRHHLAAAMAMVAALAALAGTVASLWQADRARAEAERAKRALVQTEQAFSRAQSVQDFIINLFRAAEPTRPRDELPSTEEILALGARRALDPASASLPERFGMLHTIAEIYLARNLVDQAEPLVLEAVELARRDREERPEDFAHALRQRAWLAMHRRDFDLAEARLEEAASWLAAYPEHADTARLIRADRGWLEVMKNDPPAALAILEPLYAEIRDRGEVGSRLKYAVLNPLASAYRMNGEPAKSIGLEERLITVVMEVFGSESLRHAIHLANMASAKRDLGDFEVAETELMHAILLYDRIFEDQPIEYRAAARHNLARVFLYRGEFERALEQFAISDREWAQARGIEPEAYPYAFLSASGVLGRARRWIEAGAAAERAVALFAGDPSSPDDPETYARSLLGWVACSRDDIEAGPEQHAAVHESLAGLEASVAEYRAQLREARAACLYRLRRADAALSEIDQALAEITTRGRALEISHRRLLRARILKDLGRGDESRAELQAIESALMGLGIGQSGLLAQVRSLRQELLEPESAKQRLVVIGTPE